MYHTLQISTSKRVEMIDITSQVRRLLKESGVKSGILVAYVPHTTAGITINENADPSVARDIENTLSRLVPAGKGYLHLEGNADSHIKATTVGSSINVIIENGELVLGTWQGIFFCEFDGPRNRKVYVKIIEG